MSVVKRALFLGAFSILLGFGGGFFIGQANDKTLAQLGLAPDSITLVIESSEIFNTDLISLFEQQSGFHLRILEAKTFDDFRKFSLEADLWIARTCWLERLSGLRPTPGLVHETWAEKNISPDFLTFNHQEISSAPLFWNVGTKLHVPLLETGTEVFALKENSKDLPLFLVGIKSQNTPAARLAIETLTKKQFIQTWIETIPWATTYMSLDESFIERHQKASFIRELPFQHLRLVDSKSLNCDIDLLEANPRPNSTLGPPAPKISTTGKPSKSVSKDTGKELKKKSVDLNAH